MTKKTIFQEWLNLIEDYFWVVGISLFIGGLLILFAKDPKGIIIAGVIFFLLGTFLKSRRKK